MNVLRAGVVKTTPGFNFVLDWWLKMEKYKLTLHQCLLRLDMLNLIISRIAVNDGTQGSVVQWIAQQCGVNSLFVADVCVDTKSGTIACYLSWRKRTWLVLQPILWTGL